LGFLLSRGLLRFRLQPKLGSKVPVIIAASVITLVCLIQAFPAFDLPQRLEWIVYDMRMRMAAKVRQDVAPNLAGIFIDDPALRSMADGSYEYQVTFPWPRFLYGRLISELKAQGARVVGFDILFDQLKPKDQMTSAFLGRSTSNTLSSDEYFARQLRAAGNVVLAAEASSDLFPADLFRTNAWRIGNITARPDADGCLRRVQAFAEYREWHPLVLQVVRGMDLDLSAPRFETNQILFPKPKSHGGTHAIPLKADGSLDVEAIYPGETVQSPQMPFVRRRVWHLGIVLAAAELKLDLDNARVERDRIVFRGPGSVERIIPIDREGFFYIDWVMQWKDPRFRTGDIAKLIRDDQWREHGNKKLESPFRNRIVVVGSVGVGNNISDRGLTPLEKETMLISKHWNVANTIITNRFIRRSSYSTEMFLILSMGSLSAWLTLRRRALLASFWVVMAIAAYVGLSFFLFIQYRYWLPVTLPMLGAMTMTHVAMVTYRVKVEQKERQKVRSVFSKVVSPNIVNELLRTEQIAVEGARRRITIYFADIRGFTRVTDEYQARAEDYVRRHKLPPTVAEVYLDEQAREVLRTVNLYLSLIANTIIRHNGTLDKFIGDCVMAFWGAPTPNDRHALDCVRAAIDAQRGIYKLNVERAAENKRREKENAARQEAGQGPLPLLTLLALGTGISTGDAIVGLMGDEHQSNYTVFGREVNLASRLEGFSGRGRIIIRDTTFRELQRLDPDLAATCVELPPADSLKGIQGPVQVYEVQWREIDTEMQSYDTSILTGRRVTLPTDLVPPE
jgi:adenylate cyclase